MPASDFENLTPAQKAMRDLVSSSRDKRGEIDQKLSNSTCATHGANLQNLSESQKDRPNNEHEAPKSKAQNSEEEKEVALSINNVIFRWNRILKESDKKDQEIEASDGFDRASFQEGRSEKTTRHGRPRVNAEDKARKVVVSLPPSEIREIEKNAPKDKAGRSRRSLYVRDRLRKLKDFEKRELRQMKLLKNLVNQMNELIEKTVENHEALYAEDSQSKLKLENLTKKAHEIEMVFNIVQFDQKTLNQGLNRKEMQGFRFAMELAQKGE